MSVRVLFFSFTQMDSSSFHFYVCFELDSRKKSKIHIWSWTWPGRGRERFFAISSGQPRSSRAYDKLTLTSKCEPALFIPVKLQVVPANIDPLMQQLFLMASDSSEDVRRMRDGEMERFVRDYEEGPIEKGTRQGLRSQLRCRGGSTSRCRNVNRLPSRPTLQSRCTRRGRPDRCTYLNPD